MDDELEGYLAGAMRDPEFRAAYERSRTCWRDHLARAVCNWVMNHVATRWYRDMTDGAIRYGLAAAARDHAGGES